MARQLIDDHGDLLKKALKDVPGEYLACRDIRHRWSIIEEFKVVEEAADGTRIERVLECSRCTTRRVEKYFLHMDRWGVHRMESLGSAYVYPEEYLIPEMTRTDHSREILRAEAFLKSSSSRT